MYISLHKWTQFNTLIHIDYLYIPLQTLLGYYCHFNTVVVGLTYPFIRNHSESILKLPFWIYVIHLLFLIFWGLVNFVFVN